MDMIAREEAAEQRGRTEQAQFDLMRQIEQLSRDVRLMLWVLVPTVATALMLSVVALVLALAL